MIRYLLDTNILSYFIRGNHPALMRRMGAAMQAQTSATSAICRAEIRYGHALMAGNDKRRPLLITDCDEVLLHMVSHFRDWVDEVHDVDFALAGGDFSGALKRRPSGEALRREEVWPLHQRAADLGGDLRTGLEDTFYLPNGDRARNNGELIEAIVGCARQAGREIASPTEARAMLGLA